MKALKELKSAVLKAIAKDIKLPGYSGMDTKTMRVELAKALKKVEDFDLSKYIEAPVAKVAVAKEVDKPVTTARRKKVAANVASARRTVAGRKFGRR